MGTHSDGYVEQELLTTFVTCEGDLSDPQFNTKFARLLKQLQKLLLKDPGQYLGVVKVEPWNSVRVTFTVPKEAALKLRQLAQQGDATLSQLGILSVQLEGDQAISLRIAGRVSGESQEIVLRTTTADNEGISSESSASDADHLISKSAVVSTSGGTASLIRTMTQVLSGTNVSQSMAAFKSPNIVSPVTANSIPFSLSPKVTSTAIISTSAKTLPHSYHSPFVNANASSSRDSSNIVDSSSTNSNGNSSHRFSIPPPPYPNVKTSAHLIKTNRNVTEDASTNPSPANVALSSPLLVNLLQNDGVPINNSKIAASDKHRLKPPPHIKSTVPSSTVKRKDSVETINAVAENVAFAGANATEMQVIQRIQRAPTSENLTMVTNVRIPLESCNSEVVTVTSGKLPTMNHLTTVTANVKQNFTSQSPVVNMFQRQNVTATTVTSQSKPVQSTLVNHQLANRITYSHNDNQLLTVGQTQKLGVRLINVSQAQQQQQQQQQLFQSQQLLQKQLVQQQLLPQHFQNQQQLLIQQQPFMQQKSVILQQNLQGAKVNVSSVPELATFNAGRVVQNETLPQIATGGEKFDNMFQAGFEQSESEKMNYVPVSNVISEASSQVDKLEASMPIVTCTSLQFVKSFTFTNPPPNMNVSMAGLQTKLNVTPKMNSVVFSANVSQDKLNSSSVSLPVNTVFNTNNYHNSVVTNSNAVGDNEEEQNDQNKIFNAVAFNNSMSSMTTTVNQTSLTYTTSTVQLPQYSRLSSTFSNGDGKASDKSSSNSGAAGSQSSEKEPQFLINPLTGEMEAMPNESSDNESDNQTDIFNSLPPSVANNEDSCFSFSPPVTNEKSNSMYSDDDDDDRGSPSIKKEESDLEAKFNESSFSRHRILPTGSSPNPGAGTGEKIKIRLKLEKNEPVSSAYKVDVLNTSMKKIDKPTSIVKPMPRVLSSSIPSATGQNSVLNATTDEPRVPPIRLTLRGKNVAFVKKNKKWSEESKEGDEDKKAYFNKNKLSPNEVISEKECLSADTIDLCKSPKIKNVDISEDTDELKVKLSKKKSTETEDISISQADGVEVTSPYNIILPSVRTFPTEAEVTSILRSVPTDNKMSLSCVKIKKKEGKKKLFPRDRAMMSGSVLGEDSTDTFTRVINETKCTLSSQSRGKSKSNASSLLKSVMKSTAAKEARMMNLANRNLEKRLTTSSASASPVTESAPVISKGSPVSTSIQQRRSSADLSYTVAGASFSNAKTAQRPTDTFVHSTSQFVPSPHSTNNLYPNAHIKDSKKFVHNAVSTKKVANNCKTREYQNMKPEMRKEFLLNHENKKSGHFIKKNPIEVECKQQNVVVNCLQVESNPTAACNLTNLPTTHIDLSEKVMKQRLLEDSFGEPNRKKPRIDGETNLKNGPILERLISLPGKDSELSITGMGGDSPSGTTSEHTNNQGEDSGIESMDALSEKSPNQGESPCRKEEKDSSTSSDSGGNQSEKKLSVNAYCDKPNVDSFSDSCSSNSSQCDRGQIESDSKAADNESESISSSCSKASPIGLTNCIESSATENASTAEKEDKVYERDETMSPDLDDVQPFRVTPALYTYSNPDKMRVDSPSPVLEDITDDISMSPKPVIVEQPKTSSRLKRKRKEVNDPMFVSTDKIKSSPGGKSLLEQLLIDIPSDNNVEIRRTGVSTRNTRSQLKGLSQPSPDALSMCSTSSSSSIKTPKCSPVPRNEETPSKASPRPSNRLTSRRSRKGSESSNVSNGDDSASFGMSKRKTSDNSELTKGCIGFDDQNGKKVAISTSLEVYRPDATPAVVVSSTKTTNVGRGAGSGVAKKLSNAASENVSQSTSVRPAGKKRKGNGEAVNRKTNFKNDNDVPLIQVAESEPEEHASEQSISSTTPRSNSRLSGLSAGAKQTPSTPSTSRRSVRQNHVARRRKSPAAEKLNTSNSLINANNASNINNNNNTNKNNNNTKPGANNGETCKNINEKNGVGVNMEKIENKSISKINCVTKKEVVSQVTTNSTANSIIDAKSNNGSSFGANATVTTRGNSVKQTHLINDSAIAAPPQDISHTHTVPVSEEVINTRRKTRSVANSNVSDEITNKRRRNSRDGK